MTTTTATIRHDGLLAALTHLTEAKTLVATHQCSDHAAWAAIDTAYAAVRKLERAAAKKVQAEAKQAGKNGPAAPAPIPTPTQETKTEVVQSSKASPDGSLPKPTDDVGIAGLPASQRPTTPKQPKTTDAEALVSLWTSRKQALPMGCNPTNVATLTKHATRLFGVAAVEAALSTTKAPEPKADAQAGRYEGKDGMSRLRSDLKTAGLKSAKNATKADMLTMLTAHNDKATAKVKPTATERFASLPADVQEMCLALCEQEMAARSRRAA